MSEGRTADGTARRTGSGPTRLARAWRILPHESRLAAFASLALFLTLFLPWYQVTLIAPARASQLEAASVTITGWGAFSFVEAAVLLVAAAVVVLLFQRAEGRAFHLPGGDGGVITAAGLWTCLLIVWRIFDKQGATTNGASATSSGVEWGIFIALAAAAFLAYSGSRIRAAHRPEPPLPGEERAPEGSNAAASARPGSRRREPAPPPRRRARPPAPVPADRPARAERSTPPPASSSLWASVSRARSGPAPPSTSAPPSTPAPASAPARPSGPAPPPTSAPPATSAPRSTPGPPSPLAPLDKPRRRPSADELFEHVVPEDPPTMRLARTKPPSRPTPPDEDATDPFEDRDDDTLVLGEDATLPLGDDATLPLGEDATLPLGEDATLPIDDRRKRH